MAFSNTFNSLNKVLSADTPVELTITNNTITIDPNSGSYFFLDDIDSNLTINLSNLTEGYTKTIYLRLNFDEDDIVISWPTNIKWQEIASPAISSYEDLFISLMTLDGGTTWYSEPVIKTKPLIDLSSYMANKYPSSFRTLTSIPVSDIVYFSNIRPTSLYRTFSGYAGSSNSSDATSYLELDLSSLDTSNVTNMGSMFFRCSSLISLDVSNWDTSNVTTMSSMFNDCSSLISLDVSNWDTSNVTDMFGMFTSCHALTSLDLSDFGTSNVTNMGSMFYNCSSLTSIDLSNWDTSNVTKMIRLFFSCSSLTSLDVSNWDTSNVTDMDNMDNMFDSCGSLEYLIIGSPTFKFQMKSSNCGSLNRTCKILVPSSLISTYQNATNWSSRASQFYAIENYTITRSNGQITVTPNS